MKKILKFAAPRKHYKASACIVWCFDDRFGEMLEKFIAAERLGNCDRITVGGGAKTLASGDASGREFLLNQIKTSLRLHGPKRIILMLHSDCGAYGGLQFFNDDEKEERAHHEKELRAAEGFLKDNLLAPVEIKLVFAGFDGIYEL